MPISPDASIRELRDYIRKNGLNKGLNKIPIKQNRGILIEELRKRGHTTDAEAPPEAPQAKPRKKYDRKKKVSLTEKMKILGGEEGGGKSQILYEGVRYDTIGTRAFAMPDTKIGTGGEYVGQYDKSEDYLDFHSGTLEEDHLERMEDEKAIIDPVKVAEAEKQRKRALIEALPEDTLDQRAQKTLFLEILNLEDEPAYIDVLYGDLPYYRQGDTMYDNGLREVAKITRRVGENVISVEWVSPEMEREHLDDVEYEKEEQQERPLIAPRPVPPPPKKVRTFADVKAEQEEREAQEEKEETERLRKEAEPETLDYEGVEYTLIYDEVYTKGENVKVGTFSWDDGTITWLSKGLEQQHKNASLPVDETTEEEDEPDVTSSEEEDEPTTDEEVEPFDPREPMENSAFRDYVKSLGGRSVDAKERAISDVKRLGAIKDAKKSERQKQEEETEKKRRQLDQLDSDMGASYDIDYDDLNVEGDDADTLIEYAKWDFLTRLAKKRKDYPRIHQLTGLEPPKTPFPYRVRAV